MMERTSQKSSSAVSENSPRRRNSFTGMSQISTHMAAYNNKNLIGWNINDYNIVKIYVNYIQMTIDYYFGFTLFKSKTKMINEIIDFSLDIMNVKTYRQLVGKV